MIFKTSLDGLAKIVTAGVTILFSAIFITQFNEISGWKFGMSIFMIIIYLLCFLLRPLYYKLSPEQVIIHSLLFNWTIDRNNIKSFREVSRETLRPSIRVFGVGGLFGYYGFFSNVALGDFRMLATRRDRAVLIKTLSGTKWVITPDDQKLFAAELGKEASA